MSSFSAIAMSETDQIRQLMQIAEYVNVDYVEAVKDGQVINVGEYSEMLEFSTLAANKTQLLSGGASAHTTALALQHAIEDKRNPEDISPITLTLRQQLMELAPAVSLPAQLTSTEHTLRLFANNCMSCHGAKGHGDGPLALSLDPTPTDFTELERANKRSLVGLYDAISNGIDGTAMVAMSHLTEQERWSLAFYVGSLAYPNGQDAAKLPKGISPQTFISNSPNVLLDQHPALKHETVASLRHDPALLFAHTDPLDIALQRLNAAHQAYSEGEYKLAQEYAVSAYLDGFELAENALDAYDPKLRTNIEATMMQFRQLTAQSMQEAELAETLSLATIQLEQAKTMLSEDSLSDATLFSASLVILLREGLEALLVVLALVTVLVKTERRDAVKYVHAGWLAALAGGLLTWWAAQSLVSISGASREIMEGVAALLAAVVLFYVGFWMHSKTQADNWQTYIRDNIHRHLSSGALWGIASLSFIAVYREVFETVLFYQSLMTQSLPSQIFSISSGFFAGVAILVIIAYAMVKISYRLPIRQFFSFSTYLMLGLSFVLAGKAIAALQEADIISISRLPFDFSLSWLGVYPTWEGMMTQLLIVVVSSIIIMGISPLRKRAS
jgi:high-affinity iron transporter